MEHPTESGRILFTGEGLKDIEEPTKAAEQYATAYQAQYTAKDLRGALDLYLALVSDHPDSLEATHARQQLRNIADHAIPKQESLAALVEMAIKHLPAAGSATP